MLKIIQLQTLETVKKVKFLRKAGIFSIRPTQCTKCPWLISRVWMKRPTRDQPHTLSLSLFVYLSHRTHPPSSHWAIYKWLTREWWNYAASRFLSSSFPFPVLLCHQGVCMLLRCLCVLAVICVCVKWVLKNLLSHLLLNLLNCPVAKFYHVLLTFHVQTETFHSCFIIQTSFTSSFKIKMYEVSTTLLRGFHQPDKSFWHS